MTIDEIVGEFHRHGRLSRRAVEELRLQLASRDPYSAITAATDTGCAELASSIAACLNSPDSMVRWNAAASLFTRFRDPDYLPACLTLATSDPSSMVRSVSLVGLGELLPFVADQELSKRAVDLLLAVLADKSVYPELRSSAYEGILAANDILPSDRPTPGKPLSFPEDLDPRQLARFLEQYQRTTN